MHEHFESRFFDGTDATPIEPPVESDRGLFFAPN
jgi:hypothetical protein